MQEEAPIISVVSPCHNEQDNIPLLIKELVTTLQQLGDTYDADPALHQLILIDANDEKTND